MIKVFGHKAPDTDTTCAAIVWAWYLNQHTGQDASAYILGELNSETNFVLSRWEATVPPLLESVTPEDTVIIVDTNNPQELPEGINDCTISAIIDHHKLVGGLETAVPADITIRPLASTATVIFDLIETEVETFPDQIAGLLLSCILSDTLGFRSPTTTPHDKDVAEKLASQLELDMTAYADEMLAAKSDISSFTDIGLVRLDSKKFAVGDKNFRVSVIETTNPAVVLERTTGIVAAIAEVLNEETDTDDVLFFIVDILNEESTVLTYNELTKKVIEASFDVSATEDTEILPGIISRKKQILPNLKI